MAVLYFELDADFQTCTTKKAIIAKIDAIIDALYVTALSSVTNGDVVEYTIDTGQTKNKVVYRNPNAIVTTIEAYKKLRKGYVNDIIGRSQIIVDGKNLVRKNGFGI